jgi:hypothetical protein
MLTRTWQRFLFLAGIGFAILIALELLGFILLLFGHGWLFCAMDGCYRR